MKLSPRLLGALTGVALLSQACLDTANTSTDVFKKYDLFKSLGGDGVKAIAARDWSALNSAGIAVFTNRCYVSRYLPWAGFFYDEAGVLRYREIGGQSIPEDMGSLIVATAIPSGAAEVALELGFLQDDPTPTLEYMITEEISCDCAQARTEFRCGIDFSKPDGPWGPGLPPVTAIPAR